MLLRLAVWMSSACLVVPCVVASAQITSTGSGQATSTGSGQAYPNKPVLIVASNPGSNADAAARLIAKGIAGPLGQPVTVDNHPGLLSGQVVSRAAPDGYTLIYAGGIFVTAPLLQKAPYDPIRDFSPITQIVSEPTLMVVNAAVPAKSVKEFIALVKARPGELNYGSNGYGTSANLAAELFKSLTGANIVHVPYKSGGTAVNGVLVNEVQLLFEGPQVLPHIKTGKLRALAVTSANPSAIFPDLPTVAASGLPGFEASTMQCVQAPAKTPEAIIRRLNQEIVRVMNQPEVKEMFFNRGAEVIAGSPEALGAELKAQTTKWAKVIKDAGIKLD